MIDKDIMDSVLQSYGLSEEEFWGEKRNMRICEAKYFTMYILHYERGYSISRLSRIFGFYERHTKKAIAKIKNGLLFQPHYKNRLKDIKKGYEE